MKLVSYEVPTVLGTFTRIYVLLGENIIDLNLAYNLYLAEESVTGRRYATVAAITSPDMVEFFS
jgi:hypothetical protein